MKCPLRYCTLRYNFLVRSFNNSEVQGHWYFTRIMSGLSTALSNRLIWHYLKVKNFMSIPLPSTQKTQKCENDSNIEHYTRFKTATRTTSDKRNSIYMIGLIII